jgi:hypothetical protein
MSRQQGRIVIVWRESVAMGDDAYAPHEIKIKVEDDESIESTLEKILATHYLPSIHGGKATWIFVGKNPVAVIAQQWSKPYYLVESNSRTEDLIAFQKDCQLEFIYWCQVEPEEVVASLEQGRPLPDRHGRYREK